MEKAVKITKTAIAAALALCLALTLCACGLSFSSSPGIARESVRGSGNVVTKTRLALDSANEFALRVIGVSVRGNAGGINLVIEQSPDRDAGVKITADDNVCERITAVYHEAANEVVVDADHNLTFVDLSELTIYVNAPVKKLTLDGAWNFTYDCPGVKNCDVDVNGAVNGDLTFGELEKLRVTLNGACTIDMRGKAESAAVEVNGASGVKALDLLTQEADVTINGAGGCKISVEKNLRAEVNGLGRVIYAGSPGVTKRVNGLGRVEQWTR